MPTTKVVAHQKMTLQWRCYCVVLLPYECCFAHCIWGVRHVLNDRVELVQKASSTPCRHFAWSERLREELRSVMQHRKRIQDAFVHPDQAIMMSIIDKEHQCFSDGAGSVGMHVV